MSAVKVKVLINKQMILFIYLLYQIPVTPTVFHMLNTSCLNCLQTKALKVMTISNCIYKISIDSIHKGVSHTVIVDESQSSGSWLLDPEVIIWSVDPEAPEAYRIQSHTNLQHVTMTLYWFDDIDHGQSASLIGLYKHYMIHFGSPCYINFLNDLGMLLKLKPLS